MKTSLKFRSSALGLLFLLISVSLSAQTNGRSDNASSWEPLHSSNEVTISGRLDECVMTKGQLPVTYAFLQISNTSSESRTVTFSFGLQYVEGCSSCGENSEFVTEITIPANSTIEGNCQFKRPELNRPVSNPNLEGGWEFEAINISNVSIK